jgi:hypothetical protein
LSKVAVALARGDTAAKIAKEEGVSVRTVQRWAATPECRDEVEAIRSRMLAEAVCKLQALASKSVQTLESLMTEGVADTVRLGAARAVLSAMIEVRSHVELTRRIEELERRAPCLA